VRLELPPGTAIDKSALCAQLGVSRFPVSEALGRLAAEGFVEVLPQRGTRVARIDLADCRQAMFIRRALECEAVRTLAQRADAGLLAALETNLRQQEATLDDSNRFHALDLSLHAQLLEALGYDRVKNAVESARGSLDRARFSLCTPERKLSTLHEHQAIVAALKRRDPDAAVDAMQQHLDAVMTELIDFADKNPDAVTVLRETAAA
jgi:DNA-binding GntR family transcriptional regulator